MESALGIDFGTSGTRACIINAAGKVLATNKVSSYRTTSGQPGWREQSPADWWLALVNVVSELPPELRQNISSLALDGTSSTLLLSTPQGSPATVALMYNDSRARSQAAVIEQTAPDDSAAHGATSSLAKWLWLTASNPDPTLLPLHQADWVANRLCEQYGISDYNNALKLGYDPVAQCWPKWMERLEIDLDRLPEIISPAEKMGIISSQAAKELGLPNDVEIKAGTTDSIAAFIATGANQPGQAVTSLGSTLVTKVISEKPIYAPEFGVYSHKFGNNWLVGGASNSGGAALLKHFSVEEISALSAQIDPDTPTNFHYYPLPGAGERFPVNDPDLQPRCDLSQAKNATEFLHGLLEGIAEIEQLAYQTLHQLGAPLPSEIYTAGGGASNATWKKIRQNLLPCPILNAENSEAAYGSALLSLQPQG